MRRHILAATLAIIVAAAPSDGQPCRDGRTPIGHLGFAWLHCPNGGPCWESDDPEDRWFDLTNVPRVRMVDPNGPAANLLRDGDMLIAVDGQLTTSISGGRRLANLTPGKPVKLLIQRGDEERTVTIVASAGCGLIGLSVNSIQDSAGFARHLDPRVAAEAYRRAVLAPAGARGPVARRSTPRFDLEIQGEPPLIRVDSLTGVVTLEYRNSRVTIQPRSRGAERLP